MAVLEKGYARVTSEVDIRTAFVLISNCCQAIMAALPDFDQTICHGSGP